MGFTIDVSISAVTVFVQGLVSFFSPCVLPLLPVYIGYLSGGTAVRDADGRVRYDRGTVLLNTLFFVIGISFAFFLLGLGMTGIGALLGDHRILLARIGGIIVILFGLYQLGLLGTSALLGNERRLPVSMDRLMKLGMSPLTALVMGFLFSFAWTPCVGPALSSVLLMAASARTSGLGFLLIGVYTLGFVIPFLLVGIFSTSLLELFRKHRGVVRWTVKVGGALMILMGVMMLTGWMNRVTGYLSAAQTVTAQTEKTQTADAQTGKTQTAVAQEETDAADTADEADGRAQSGEGGLDFEDDTIGETNQEPSGDTNQEEQSGGAKEENRSLTPEIDFTLRDQYGNLQTLSDYRGKVVFLNFCATWCPPCRAEMPDIQKLYEKYGDDSDVVILGVATPGYGSEISQEEMELWLVENGYSYPVAMDATAEVTMQYRVSAIPTTYMITRKGNIMGYVAGSMSLDIMEDIIAQTLENDE